MTFICAEAGVNHNGRWETGLDLIDAAHKAGADAVKFQMFFSNALWGDDRIKHLEFGEKELLAMAAHCKEVGIEFMCTPFGIPEVEFLTPMVRRFKVASGCLKRWDLLEAISKAKKPVIMSTGMSSIDEVREAAVMFARNDLTLLHCTSAYPCPLEEVNLAAMDALRHLGKVGYSDHTSGIAVSLAAVARGAVVIEKHLTMDRKQEGPDHKSSIEPASFAAMVSAIRSIEKAIGSPEKAIQPSEGPLRKAWGRGK